MKLQNLIHIVIGIVCVGLLPGAQAVVPPPDGGYPGGNTAAGQNTLFSLTTGTYNTALGWSSLTSDTTGKYNTAIGAATLLFNTADQNTATGTGALLANSTGAGHTASGMFALFSNTTGNYNTAYGGVTLQSNTTGSDNTANGISALNNNTAGHSNTASGILALSNNTTGNYNTAVGDTALAFNTTGSNNIALGVTAGNAVVTADNVTCIGANVPGADVSNTTWIGNVYGNEAQSGQTAPVVVFVDGQLATVVSSERFKKDIATMEKASQAILSLRPVTFHYKTDTTGTPQFGLIAEEVAKINPALVLPDKEGKPYTVRYEAVNAMLLNEFLKEHRKVEELTKHFQATVAQLTARLDEQASQIQKLSAQLATASPSRGGLEASKPAPQVVNNP